MKNMAPYSNIFNIDKDTVKKIEISPSEAYIAIIFSAIMADEDISANEMDKLKFLVGKYRGMENLSEEDFNTLIERFKTTIKEKGIGNFLTAATGRLNEGLRQSAFANAVDIALADGSVHDKEKQFLSKLQKAVGVSNRLAKTIVDVVSIKNQGTTSDIFSNSNPNKMFE